MNTAECECWVHPGLGRPRERQVWASGREDQGLEREGGKKKQALDVWAGVVSTETLPSYRPC